ncbi:Rv3235 family protein [Gordonia sp. NPDC058843]|uniref:Rv3235 family protein n=1 Tax=Gordonia sp. NPDC058843 TaxID=3346648 RepID=UPI0036A5C43F
MRPLPLGSELTPTRTSRPLVSGAVQTPRVRVRPAPRYEPAGPVVAPTPGVRHSTAVRPFPGTAPGTGSARKTAAAAAEARRFTVAVSRLLFEVVDRRRSVAHLGDVVSPAIADQVAALVRHDAFRVPDPTGAGASGTVPTPPYVPTGNVLRRVHVQLCDPAAAEVFGSYEGGGRTRAFAGRIERKPIRIRGSAPAGRRSLGRVEYRWQLVALEFG